MHGGTHAAQLSESTTAGSLAYARTDLTGDQTDLTATGAFQVTAEGASNANVPIFRLLDATGARAVSLYRQNAAATTCGSRSETGAPRSRPASFRSPRGACSRSTRSSPAQRAPSR